MPDRYTIEPAGGLWMVTDHTTGESFMHLTEQAAQAACRDGITTGITPTETPTPTGE